MRCDLAVEMQLAVRVDEDTVKYYADRSMFDLISPPKLNSNELREAFKKIISKNMTNEVMSFSDITVELIPKAVRSAKGADDQWSVTLGMNLLVEISDDLFEEYIEDVFLDDEITVQDLTDDDMIVIWEEILHGVINGYTRWFTDIYVTFYPISVTRVSC